MDCVGNPSLPPGCTHERLRHRKMPPTTPSHRRRWCYLDAQNCIVYHRKGCRKARPLCYWQRQRTEKYSICTCGAYPWPHRYLSGRCAIGIPWGIDLAEYYAEEDEEDPVPF